MSRRIYLKSQTNKGEKMHFNIAAIPGDGIGPELIEQSIVVLEKIGKNFGHSFSFEKVQAGRCRIDG